LQVTINDLGRNAVYDHRMARRTATSGLDAALARVGDRWTLLLVDALLDGSRRFNELAAAVPGIAPNILTHRLRHLEREGLVVAETYSERPLRFVYELTERGRELAGAVRLLSEWGAQHGEEELLRHSACGTPLEARWYCDTCERAVDDAEASDVHFV
jgi:DNA-binding HxlR family transcriptional regulator